MADKADTGRSDSGLVSVSLVQIFRIFFRVGLVAFGPAMLAEMKRQVIKRYRWLREEELLQGLALAQVLPGATFVSLAVWAGNRLRRAAGAVAAFSGLLLPPFAIMLLVSYLYFAYGNLPGAAAVVAALGAVVVALVANATLDIGRTALKDWRGVFIAGLAFAAALLHLNLVAVLAIGIAAGLVLFRTPPAAEGPPPEDTGRRFPLQALAVLAVVLGALAALAGFHPPLLSLGATFFKIGLLVFGNGYTMLPFIQQEVVDLHHWVTARDFAAGVAFGQVTPGPVVITATFIGYRVAGVLGALAATIGVFAPTLFLVLAASPVQARLRSSPWVRAGEQGLVASFVGLMVLVVFNLGRYALGNVPAWIVATSVLGLLRFKRLDPLWAVAGGVLLYLVLQRAVGVLI
ncbi:chromate transporter [Thermodesulfitimonas autotrophica]|uniref:Chromate transporter n=1 Tax=Thermodesulfitimonas autotrophica TaxID=1894989 RepID=A0A3N5APV6_9THEO|nr:chromate efflux transporter [Thermodesulfitimonas autotrophica]RPF46867.1 chromate transporter [Thermodesulfitimonas autotrophica]